MGACSSRHPRAILPFVGNGRHGGLTLPAPVPWAIAVAFLGASACTDPATQLLVLVDTDYAVPSELATVSARISDADGREISSSEFTLVAAGEDPSPARFVVPLSFAVVPRDDDAGRRVVIEIAGMDAFGGVLVTRRARTGFVEGKTLLLPMFLLESCEAVECGSDQTCTERGCETDRVDPGSLIEVAAGDELRWALDAGPDAGSDGGWDAAADAGDGGLPDAGRDSGADAGADAGVGVCVGADTDRCCRDGTCDYSCPPSGVCNAGCDDTASCTLTCSPGALCTMRSGVDSSSTLICGSRGRCTLTCAGSDVCQLECGSAAQCTVECGGSRLCGFTNCPGGGTMCPGGIWVCNLSCP